MRKTILFAFFASLLLLISCHKSYKDIEEKAKIALTNRIYGYDIYPYEIRDFKVAYISDSLCILRFHFSGESNSSYHYFNNNMEYVFLCYNGEWFEYSRFTNDDILKDDIYFLPSVYEDADNNPDKSIVERLHKEREKAEKTGNDYYLTAYTYLIAAYGGKKADLDFKRKLNIVNKE
ncbi:MAG: hypothetical protein LUC88_10485 [Prevotella sp.]|nr:hypothetical protein [Prevotella sp.]